MRPIAHCVKGSSVCVESHKLESQTCQFGYGSIPINTIFSGMNIHLPAILMFTRGQGFDPLPFQYSTNEKPLKNIPKLPTCSNFEQLHHLHRIPHLPSPQRWHSGRRCCHLQIAGMAQGLFLRPGDSFGSSLVGNSLALNHRVPITFIIVVFFLLGIHILRYSTIITFWSRVSQASQSRACQSYWVNLLHCFICALWILCTKPGWFRLKEGYFCGEFHHVLKSKSLDPTCHPSMNDLVYQLVKPYGIAISFIGKNEKMIIHRYT
jgi:hypothetical protein